MLGMNRRSVFKRGVDAGGFDYPKPFRNRRVSTYQEVFECCRTGELLGETSSWIINVQLRKNVISATGKICGRKMKLEELL
jgi:transcription elongation factor Elf1